MRMAFVLPYFGAWPDYWEIWARSVASNQDVDFIIFTDLEAPSYVPTNIRLVYIKLSEVELRLSDVVGIQVKLQRLHKICDYKPFYGLAFADYLVGYDYWGYCDMDIVFGDLSNLKSRALSTMADFVSPWVYTVGHCNLLKNVERVNRVALKTKDLHQRLQVSFITFIDEGALCETALNEGGFSFAVVDDLPAEWAKSVCFLGATADPTCRLCGLQGDFIIHCSNGRVVVHGEDGRSHEVLYFHFMGMKHPRYWKDWDGESADHFSFTPYGFVPRLVPPLEMHTLSFKWKSLRHRLPSQLYAFVRGLVPEPLVRRLKSALGRLKKKLAR